MTQGRLILTAALAGSALAIFAAPSFAQNSNRDYGWAAWYGCWHARGAPSSEQLCIVPDGPGVRMVTVVDGSTREETRIIADDHARDVAQDDCRGSEQARWSSDQRRVFLNAQLTCGSDMRRVSSGILAFNDPNHWVSVQAVTVDGQTATRTTEYELAEAPSIPSSIANLLNNNVAVNANARVAAARDLSQADVDEAANYVDDAAVQEWLRGDDAANYSTASGSALDMLARDHSTTVVERPVYVERTYVTNYVRSCWDPFYSGFVIGVSRHVGVAVNVGSGCGYHRYYTRYSPWGYGLYGWRAYQPVVVINRPHYSYRSPTVFRHTDYRDRNEHRDYGWHSDNSHRDNSSYRDDNRRREDNGNRDHQDTSTGWDRSHVTRGGYTRGDNGQRDGQREHESTRQSTPEVRRDPEPSRITRSVPTQTPAERVQRAAEVHTAQPREAHRKHD